MSATVKDDLPKFRHKLYEVLDDAFREAASDIIKRAKERAPFNKGPLRADSNVNKEGNLHWRISFFKEYAAVQELVEHKNYTTSGTGAHYLERSGDEQVAQLKMIAKKHALRAKV